ncbi:MAG: hypothetical protein R6V57_07830 [Vicinamibacterales bacterium]
MRVVRLVASVFLAAAWLAPSASAQTSTGPRAADSASPEAIIAALYDVISGPAGEARDWDRFRGLFAIGARLLPAAPKADGSAPVALSPDDYVTRSNDRLVKDGFFEEEVSGRTEAFGTVRHVFSTYESRRAKADEKPFARGINSIQLMQHGGRWWIVTVMWDQERADNPIPAKYLEARLP